MTAAICGLLTIHINQKFNLKSGITPGFATATHCLVQQAQYENNPET